MLPTESEIEARLAELTRQGNEIEAKCAAENPPGRGFTATHGRPPSGIVAMILRNHYLRSITLDADLEEIGHLERERKRTRDPRKLRAIDCELDAISIGIGQRAAKVNRFSTMIKKHWNIDV
jgi:hypothetical protein